MVVALLVAIESPRQRDEMLRRSQIVAFLKTLAVITVLFLGVVWFKEKIVNTSVDDLSNSVQANSEVESEPRDNVLQLNVNHSFPGVFNLMEDAARFTGTLQRPIKECSLGKSMRFYSIRTDI